MLTLLVSLLIAVVIAGLLIWVVTLLPLPGPWNRIVQVLVGLILLVWLLEYFVPLHMR